MLRFKSFAPGEWKDEDITEFVNTHIIIRDQYFETGAVYLYYKNPDDLGITDIDRIERLDKAITVAQKEAFDAERSIDEQDSTIKILEEKIKASSPNDGEKWDQLQAELKGAKNQKILDNLTAEGRHIQARDLMAAAAEIKV